MFYDNIKSHKIGRYIFTEKPEGGGGQIDPTAF